MRCLIVASILLYLTGCIDAAALICSPGSEDPACLTQISSDKNPIEITHGRECEAGSEWDSNCHKCSCTEAGVARCVRQDSCDTEVTAEPIRCKPNSTFHNECNTCVCLDNGMGLCTMRACISRYISQPLKKDTSDTSNSVSIDNHQRIFKRGVCKPSTEFQIDCNQCKCATTGLSYTCTHNECLDGEEMNKEVEVFMQSEGTDHIERHSVCKPRDTFYIGCNTCHCNTYGTDYSCTNKPCPLPEDVELFHELKEATTKSSINTKVVCIANRMFIKDCNTCWCNEDGTSYFCTRRVCIEQPGEGAASEDPMEELKLKEFKKECKPNEVFEIDCNMCRCNPDGKSFSCTRRACFDIDDKNTSMRKSRAASEAPKTCQPGTEFRMDCNKCLCNDEGQDFSCTRIDCAALNNNGGVDPIVGRRKRDLTEQIESECVPGSVFDRECNVCRCTSDGRHAACTLKRCSRDSTAELSTEPTQSFRCTPGDQFKRDCNDCTCSADGKNVFCTLRLCDQDISDI